MNTAFIHIPKNAGTTIARALMLKSIEVTYPYDPNTVDKYGGGKLNFLCTKYEDALQLMTQRFIETSFKFVFCRNPFDRAVSSWVYLHKNSEGFERTPEEFLEFTRELPQHISKKRVVTTQSSWIEGAELDYIGRVEHLENDLHVVAATIGVKINEPIPMDNTTEHLHYTEYYSNEAIENIVKVYECDFERFGYSTYL